MTVISILTPLAIVAASALVCLTFRVEVMDRPSGLFIYDRFTGNLKVCGQQQDRFVCRQFE